MHPAAKTLVDIARAQVRAAGYGSLQSLSKDFILCPSSPWPLACAPELSYPIPIHLSHFLQDAEIGDGTTTVTLLASELLRLAKPFVEDGVHPQIIIRGYRKAAGLAIEKLNSIAISMGDDVAARRSLLEKCAKTSLNSKLIARYQDFFAPIIVDAIEAIGDSLDMSLIGVKKVPGGSVTESFLVKGVAFKRTFSYAGFEQQPKRFGAPKILLLNLELELKSEKENAEVRIDDVAAYQSIVDAEWDIINDKLAKCATSGASIILSKLPIGDLATQYFAGECRCPAACTALRLRVCEPRGARPDSRPL